MDDIGPVVRLAERGRAGQVEIPGTALGELACALADYRTKHFADANRRLKELLAHKKSTSNHLHFALISSFLAMLSEAVPGSDYRSDVKS